MASSSSRGTRVKEKTHVVPRLDWNSIQLGRMLGAGRFGEVYAATSTQLSTNVAVKVLAAATAQQVDLFWAEVNVLGDLHHPNILQLLGVGKCEDGRLFVATEQLELDLAEYLARRPELSLFDRLCLIRDLASGVACLHSRNPPIIHRDLKPTNCLITNHGILKVADFGLSADMSTNFALATGVGTILYQSPEVLIENAASSTKSDVYAFALVAWSILTSRSPFKTYETIGILDDFKDAIQRGDRPELQDDKIPSAISKLLELCWDPDPERRYSMSEVVTEIDKIILEDLQLLPDFLKQFWENFNAMKLSDRHTVSWSSFAKELLKLIRTPDDLINNYIIERNPVDDTSKMLSCLKLLLFNDASLNNNSRVTFPRFYQVFGTLAYHRVQNMGYLLDHLVALAKKDYFFGHISIDLVTRHLTNSTPGAPILRASGSPTNENWLTVSIMPPDVSGQVDHSRIFHIPGDVYKLYLDDDTEKSAETIPQLIDECYPDRNVISFPTPYAEYFQNGTPIDTPKKHKYVTRT